VLVVMAYTNYLHSLVSGSVHSFNFNIMTKNEESPATTEKVQTTPLTATQKKLLKDVRLQCLKSDHFYNEVLTMLQPATDSVSNSNNSQQ